MQSIKRVPLYLMMLIVALPQLSETIYTPSLPAIAAALNTTANPTARGQAIVLFATGLGPTSALSNGLNATTNPMSVIINRRELTPFFAGLAPGFIGLYQLNVILPANLPRVLARHSKRCLLYTSDAADE